jgi:hypothetical protein
MAFNKTIFSLKTSFTFIFITVLLVNLNVIYTNAQKDNIQNNNPSNIYVYNYSVIHDLDNNTTIIGSVTGSHNLTLTYPVKVTVGLNVYNNYSKKYETLIEQPFKKVIYDINEPIPFKFSINSNKYYLDSNSIPYVNSIKKADMQSTKINTFTLDYNEALLGPSKELYGTVTNTGPNTLKNLTLYAIVHAKNGTQIDSVKTIIPLINSQQKVNFKFIPNKAVKDLVFTYSCVGGEAQDINAYQTIHLNQNKTFGYKFSGFMEINSVKYDNKTNEIKINVNNLYPVLGPLSLQLIPLQTSPLDILIDSQSYKSQIFNNNSVSKIDLFIPQGKHEINIKGII